VSPMFFLGFLIHFSRFASLPRSFCLLAAAPSHDKTQLRANDEQMPPQTLSINHFKPCFRGASATPSGKLFQRRFSGTCPGSQASCIWRSQTCLPCLCTRVHRRADTDRHRHAACAFQIQNASFVSYASTSPLQLHARRTSTAHLPSCCSRGRVALAQHFGHTHTHAFWSGVGLTHAHGEAWDPSTGRAPCPCVSSALPLRI
jgi:hypothetical protein